MPKARSDQVITHRIELQETERATLEAALAGRFVTNSITAVGSVFAGIGSALAPFGGTFTALTALWIADRTFDEIKELTSTVAEKAVDYIFPQLGDAQSMYQFVCSWLESKDGYRDILRRDYEVTDYLVENDAIPALVTRFRAFRTMIQNALDQGGEARHHIESMSPVKLWISFYPINAYANDVKEATLGRAKKKVWPF